MSQKTQENEELKTAWAETDRALLERDEAVETAEALSQDLAEAEAALAIMQTYADDVQAAAERAFKALTRNMEEYDATPDS